MSFKHGHSSARVIYFGIWTQRQIFHDSQIIFFYYLHLHLVRSCLSGNHLWLFQKFTSNEDTIRLVKWSWSAERWNFAEPFEDEVTGRINNIKSRAPAGSIIDIVYASCLFFFLFLNKAKAFNYSINMVNLFRSLLVPSCII